MDKLNKSNKTKEKKFPKKELLYPDILAEELINKFLKDESANIKAENMGIVGHNLGAFILKELRKIESKYGTGEARLLAHYLKNMVDSVVFRNKHYFFKDENIKKSAFEVLDQYLS
jgi:hypothetical protein